MTSKVRSKGEVLSEVLTIEIGADRYRQLTALLDRARTFQEAFRLNQPRLSSRQMAAFEDMQRTLIVLEDPS